MIKSILKVFNCKGFILFVNGNNIKTDFNV